MPSLLRWIFVISTVLVVVTSGFTIPNSGSVTKFQKRTWIVRLAQENDGVVELGDSDDEPEQKPVKVVAPFLSQQNEIADGVLNPNLSDPKQTRVIIYIILSLVPVLFLIPLILGSRDFIPMDALPPVSL